MNILYSPFHRTSMIQVNESPSLIAFLTSNRSSASLRSSLQSSIDFSRDPKYESIFKFIVLSHLISNLTPVRKHVTRLNSPQSPLLMPRKLTTLDQQRLHNNQPRSLPQRRYLIPQYLNTIMIRPIMEHGPKK